jgi:uncharacterized repeat protein (TIGR03803 family)
VDATGHVSVLYTFTGAGGDGCGPEAALVRDSSGNLYGTTVFGGASGAGTVFELTSGGQEKVLYSFTPSTGDGSYPFGRLVLDSLGKNLYGTTPNGGAFAHGVAFKVTTGGQETVLYNFSGAGADGSSPSGELLVDSQGNLYGTTTSGGSNGYGMVFKITP